MTNVLSLRVRREAETAPWIEVRVDGELLEEIARPVEAPLAEAEGSPQIAGSYEGPEAHTVLSPEFLGDEVKDGLWSGKVPVLVCEGCREEGCWPLLVRVTATDDQIMWDDFEQPHRPGWDLSPLGPFVFQASQYRAEIQAIDLLFGNQQ